MAETKPKKQSFYIISGTDKLERSLGEVVSIHPDYCLKVRKKSKDGKELSKFIEKIKGK